MSKKLFPLKKRVLIPSLIGALLLFAFLFRAPLFRFGVETYLNAKYPTSGGGKFSYDSIDWISDRIRLKDVSIYSKEAFLTAYLNQVDVLFTDLKKFTLGTALSLDRPQITIYKKRSKCLYSREFIIFGQSFLIFWLEFWIVVSSLIFLDSRF